MMMKLLPYDAFELETAMPAEGVVATLHEMIEPTKWLRLSRDHKVFQGSIKGEGFKITRIIHYRNSFLPIIRGRFRPGPSGITIEVTMRIHPFVTAFMCLWFGGVGMFIFAVISGLVLGQTKPDPMLLIPFALLLFGWALVAGAFWFEAKKTKAILVEMFKGQISGEQGVGTLRR